MSVNRAWLLPLLRVSGMSANGHRAKLAFFKKEVLGLARQCDSAAAASRTPQTSQFFKSRVVDLWSFFPCFCNNPTDIEETLPALVQTLVRAMADARYPQLVVSSIQPNEPLHFAD